jgi:hypothetical protein
VSKTQQEIDDIIYQAIRLEPSLTIFELFLLLRVATNQQEQDQALAPLAGRLCEVDLVLGSETELLELARQARLMRMGLLTMEKDCLFSLTEQGQVMAQWWIEALRELGFQRLSQPTPTQL